MMFNILPAVLVALLGTAAAVGDAAADKVASLSSLPGWPETADFDMYSGFIAVPETTKQIHYVFLESRHDPATDPTVVWFNGGPGCSSMLGFLQETGPYVLLDGETTYSANEYSWNNETNMLYIEQPAGVGYSYCNNLTNPEDCVHTDNSSAHDNLQVLLGFFDKFNDKPYRTNAVFLAGESYAGIYVPLLSYFVNEHNNNQTTEDTKINLQGFMVGNGVTNWTYDTTPATFDVTYYRSMISQQLKDQIDAQQCDFTGIGYGDYSLLTPECVPLLNEMYDAFDGVNIYNIYGKCWYWQGNTTNFTSTDLRNKLYGKYISSNGEEHEYQKFFSAYEYTPWVKPLRAEDTDYGIPGCIYALPAAEHLNLPEVRAALHVDTYDQVWRMCSVRGKSTFSYTKDARASQWAYESLKDTPIRMMHFSGDKDASVPTIGTERWVNNLEWKTTQEWIPYMMDEPEFGSQTAGFYQEYEGDFTFITVHGAGHMVPQDQRARAYHILFNWLLKKGEFGPRDEQDPEFVQK